MANTSKWLLCLVFMLYRLGIWAQTSAPLSDTTKHPTYFEGMFVPSLYYNSASLGISKQVNAHYEQAFTAAAFFISFTGLNYYTGLSLRYNFNFILRSSGKNTRYIPVWLSPRYVYEGPIPKGEGFSSQSLFCTLGTGYGLKYFFKNKQALRVEGGPGMAFYSDRDDRTTPLNSTKFEKIRIAPAFRLTLKYMIPF